MIHLSCLSSFFFFFFLFFLGGGGGGAFFFFFFGWIKSEFYFSACFPTLGGGKKVDPYSVENWYLDMLGTCGARVTTVVHRGCSLNLPY